MSVLDDYFELYWWIKNFKLVVENIFSDILIIAYVDKNAEGEHEICESVVEDV